jgi:hypothetical protein
MSAADDLGLITPSDKSHYEALGRFIAAFATAESALHVIARKLSGLSDDKARAIFGGMRLADITDRIRHFMNLDRANGTADDAMFSDIEACLEQLGHISSHRHNIVHRGATYFGGAFIVTNSMIAKTLASIESEAVSEKTLRHMALDCSIIFLRLLQTGKLTVKNDQWLTLLRQRPWLYKPPPPKPRNPKRRGSPESRKRQRGASRR